jgi:hypothetical protein
MQIRRALNSADMPDPNQQEAYELLSSAWTRGLFNENPNIQAAAKLLAKKTENAGDDADVYIWSTICAIEQYAAEQPTAIDFMLQVYAEASKLLPDTVKNEYGTGPKAALKQLQWWLTENATGFYRLRFPKDIGTVEPKDDSNLRFDPDDVEQKLPLVLEDIQGWKTNRVSWTIAAALLARSFALDVSRGSSYNGDQVKFLIDGVLKENDRWSKAQFIGCCVLLRGCAKSVLSVMFEHGTKDSEGQWIEGFKRLLKGEGRGSDDFTIKYHAAVSDPSLVIISRTVLLTLG